jgi:hypothetical protein
VISSTKHAPIKQAWSNLYNCLVHNLIIMEKLILINVNLIGHFYFSYSFVIMELINNNLVRKNLKNNEKERVSKGPIP